MGTAAILIAAGAVAFSPMADSPAHALSSNRQELAQSLMSARAAGNFDSISYGVIDRIIAPVANGVEPAIGCKIDTRILQVMAKTVQDYGSMKISDISRSCPGVLQDPTCPTAYTSPHCADPARAVDIIRVGNTGLTGDAGSVPYLRYLDAFVPVGTQAGQNNCGSNVAFTNITSRIADYCNHIHLALPASGDLAGIPNSSASTPDRYAVLGADGTLWVKEANPWASWVAQGTNVSSFSLSGYRIGVVTTDGVAYVKDGDLYAAWVAVAPGGMKSIVLDGSRVAVVGSDGKLNVKEGSLSAPWVEQSSGVAQVALSGNRIGIRGTNSAISVKEGNLYQPWVAQGSGTDLSLSGNRIGVISGGNALVKEGTMYAGWVTLIGGSDIELSGNRVGVVGAGTLVVKEGNLYAGWTTQLEGVNQFSLSGDKIGVIAGATSIVKKGNLYDGWVNQLDGTVRIQVAN